MAIFIALVIIMIWASMLAWIYALINPFTQQLGSIQRYNVAYYGAIASVERAELVLRWHKAWFEWSWWFIDKETFWNSSDYQDSIIKKQYYWQLALTGIWNWIFWKITSMTSGDVIPEPGHWDLDPDISSWENYNKLTFAKALQFAFYEDITDKDWYYTWVTNDNIQDIGLSNNLNISIRVPLKLVCKYKNISDCSRNNVDKQLDANNNIDLDWDWVIDDIIVNRSLFGYTWDQQFTIFPSINVNSDNTVADDDTAIREKTINNYNPNNTNNVIFDTNSSDKDTNPTTTNNGSDYNVTWFNESPDGAVDTWFDNVLDNNSDTVSNAQANNEVSEVNLKLSLVNYLEYEEGEMYPYLEVKVNAWTSIPWKNFNIVGEWKAWAYDVKIMIKKPIFNSSAASDFTVLF